MKQDQKLPEKNEYNKKSKFKWKKAETVYKSNYSLV